MKLSKVYNVKTYEEAVKKCPKGYRLLEIWELVKLACEKHPIIFETNKGEWIFFWSSTENKYGVLRLGRGYVGDWLVVGDIRDSYDYGRVVFVKEEKK